MAQLQRTSLATYLLWVSEHAQLTLPFSIEKCTHVSYERQTIVRFKIRYIFVATLKKADSFKSDLWLFFWYHLVHFPGRGHVVHFFEKL